jgi:hypothetical protein
MFHAVTRFALAVLIGVGATVGWQAYGDAAKDMIVARSPQLAWLLPVSAMKSPIAATAANPALQLEPLGSNLEIMRRSLEQLAGRQEQMARDIAALQAIDEDIRQKVSSPPSLVQAASAAPQPKLAPPREQPSGAPSSAPRQSRSTGPISLAPSR